MASYLDGARLFNAAVASGRSLRELAAPFRLAGVALSKGLGCPVGSVLAGAGTDIDAARRVRRMFGGAMRQAGVLAAAGLFALDHNLDRLAIDHANARRLAETIAAVPGVLLDLATVQTNIIVFRLADKAPDAATVVELAKTRGCSRLGVRTADDPRRDPSRRHRGECERAGQTLAKAIAG